MLSTQGRSKVTLMRLSALQVRRRECAINYRAEMACRMSVAEGKLAALARPCRAARCHFSSCPAIQDWQWRIAYNSSCQKGLLHARLPDASTTVTRNHGLGSGTDKPFSSCVRSTLALVMDRPVWLADRDVPPTTNIFSTGEHVMSSWSPEIDSE